MPTSDERGDDEEAQPGDLVIEVHRGVPIMYTEPGGENDKPKKAASGDRNRKEQGKATRRTSNASRNVAGSSDAYLGPRS